MASLFRHRPRPQSLRQVYRAFSTTPTQSISLQLDKNDPEAVADTLPPYPYGPTRWYKQSSLGLYGGQRVRFGNNVGEKFENKTRRTWHPNVLTRKLYSKALGRQVQVRVTTRVLRTIDKLGGLDEYLLGEKEGRIRKLGESGWWLRWAIMQTPSIRARFREERIRLGVPEEQVMGEEKEVAEAQSVIEEASEVDAEDAAVEVSETVGTDGAFQVEQPPGVPPLKFRVGPGKHLILTAEGWRRTRPDPERLVKIAQSRILRTLEEHVLPEREAAFELQLKESQATQRPEERLSKVEKAEMLKELKREWRKELRVQAKEMYDRKVAVREQGKLERKERKRAEREAERERRKVAVVEE